MLADYPGNWRVWKAFGSAVKSAARSLTLEER
jgi:hypothetical protein